MSWPSSHTGPSIPPHPDPLLAAFHDTLTSIQSDLKHALAQLAAMRAAIDGWPSLSVVPPKAYADAPIQASSAPQGLVPASHEYPCQPGTIRLIAVTAQCLAQHDALLPDGSHHHVSEVGDGAESPRAASHTAISANNTPTLHGVTHPSDDAQLSHAVTSPAHDDAGMSSETMLGDTAQTKDPSECLPTEDDGASRFPTPPSEGGSEDVERAVRPQLVASLPVIPTPPSSMTEDQSWVGVLEVHSELPTPLTPQNEGMQTGRAEEGAVDGDGTMDDAGSKSGSAHDETPRTPHDAMAFEPDPNDTYAYIQFSSPAVPRMSPPPASSMTTPSRYATPFEAAEACVDEEVVWRALVVGLINEDGRESEGEWASMTPLAVDPAVLHVNGPSSEEQQRATHALVRSVSPLTSLDESDGEEAIDADRDRGEDTAVAMAPSSVSRDVETSSSASLGAFELGASTAPVSARICAASKAPLSMSPAKMKADAHAVADPRARSGSLAAARRIVGGPTASVEELALLARRVPLRIRVRVPEGMWGAKRKLDAVGDWDGIDRIAEAGATGMRTPRAGSVGDGVGSDVTSDVPPSRKRTKKAREHGCRDKDKSKRGSKAALQHSSPSSASAVRREEEEARRDAHTPTCVPQEVVYSPMSSPTKTDIHKPVVRDDSQWSALPRVFLQWDTQFIQCDNCDMWYHYGCVGVASGDPRLEPSAVYICPMCHNQSARRQTPRLLSESCARPDCPRPQASSDADHFFVEKLVGRKKVDGYMYLWLAKWEGYPMTQATWIPRENVDGDGSKLFNTFIETALEEGVDLARDVVLLREAVDAGWDSDTC